MALAQQERTDATDFAERLFQTSLKMNHIIDELLLFATVRQAEVEPLPLDMAEIVAEVEKRMAYTLAQSAARLVKPEQWPVALGHAAWVEQVWVNYISNALKYSTSPKEDTPLDVELGYDGPVENQIRFWVRDHGPGIAPEAKARLFTPFTRLDKARAEGHGLGLSVVKRIVEKLGGRVGVESVLGQGSLFFFTLPAATDRPSGPRDGRETDAACRGQS